MPQAIQSLFTPGGFGVKQGGAADLFAGGRGGASFGDVLEGASRRGGGPAQAVEPKPLQRTQAGGDDAEGDGAAATDAATKDGARTQAASDVTDEAPEAASERAGAEAAGEVKPERAEVVAVDDDAPADDAAPLGAAADPLVVEEPASWDGDAADDVSALAERAAAGTSPGATAAAAESGLAGAVPPGERNPSSATGRPGADAQSAKAAVQAALTGDGQAVTQSDTTNPVVPASTSASVTAEPSETTPLILQLVTGSPATSVAVDGTPSPSAPTPTAATPAIAPATVDATPGPIPIQGGSATAAAQLSETQAARADENAALNQARLSRGLASAVNQKGGAITLRLTPPEMGTVRIQMQLSGTTLAAALHAETASAHALLTQQLGQLRTSLESQGLHVERLTVQPMQPTQQGSSTGQQRDDAQQPNQQPHDGRSRGQNDRQPGEQRDNRGDTEAPGSDRQRQPASFLDHLDLPPGSTSR